MAGFINAELIAIRDSLVCGNCNTVFKGTDSQARKVKYEKQTVYCSKQCRAIKHSEKLSLPDILVGECRHCHKELYSRNLKKIYCDNVCYMASDQHKEMIHNNLQAIAKQQPVKDAIKELNRVTGKRILNKDKTLVGLRAKGTEHLSATTYTPEGELFHCLECNAPKYRKPSEDRKFCSHKHFVAYRAKRFARRLANPEPLKDIADYTTFLEQDILPCIVQGCTWEGQHLTLHCNLEHGITAREFKQIFGFNLTEGIVGKDLSNRYSQRALEGIAKDKLLCGLEKARATPRTARSRLRSPQALENARNSRKASVKLEGPMRICEGCNMEFQQSTIFGFAKYCTKLCRAAHYASEAHKKSKVAERNLDGTFKWVERK